MTAMLSASVLVAIKSPSGRTDRHRDHPSFVADIGQTSEIPVQDSAPRPARQAFTPFPRCRFPSTRSRRDRRVRRQ